MRLWGALAVLGALVLSGCSRPVADYRYRMTIEVETPEGLKSYSSVREVTITEVSSINDSSRKALKYELKGEAVVLDLPNGQTVFALLSRPDNVDYAIGIAGAALLSERRADELSYEPFLRRMVKVEGPRELPRTRLSAPPAKGLTQLWPFFVRFRDINDPKSAEEVSPDALGGGAYVKRITIEVTDDDVTTGIEKRLSWLPTQHGSYLNGPSSRTAPFGFLDGGAFSTELFQ